MSVPYILTTGDHPCYCSAARAPRPVHTAMTFGQIDTCLRALNSRERIVVKFAVLAGLERDTSEINCQRTVADRKEEAGSLVVSGIAITHPDRVISETGQVTKGELAEYFARMAAFILPHVVRRPLSLLRCPSGIDGECFFQRNPGRGLGADIRTFEFRHKGKKYEYLYIEDEKGLLEVIQMGAIELHPWGAPVDAIDYPDRMIFDLDPAPELPFEAVKLAAQDLRQRLRQKGLESVLKCTGGQGLHVTVPLAGRDKWPEVKAFAGSLADEMVAATPEVYIATMSKAKRLGKSSSTIFAMTTPPRPSRTTGSAHGLARQ